MELLAKSVFCHPCSATDLQSSVWLKASVLCLQLLAKFWRMNLIRGLSSIYFEFYNSFIIIQEANMKVGLHLHMANIMWDHPTCTRLTINKSILSVTIEKRHKKPVNQVIFCQAHYIIIRTSINFSKQIHYIHLLSYIHICMHYRFILLRKKKWKSNANLCPLRHQ